MKIKHMILCSLLFLTVLVGCQKEQQKEEKILVCATQQETFKYVYNDETLVAYYYNGVKQGSDVFDLAIAYVDTAGGINNYIRNVQTNFEAMGLDCHKE